MSNPPCHLRPTRLSSHMLMKYQDGKVYPDFSMHVPLILEGKMVMFSLTYSHWRLRMKKNLKISIAEFSDFNKKLSSLEKLSLLPELSYITRSNCQIVIKSSINCAKDDIPNQIPWQQRKIWCIYRSKHLWNLSLSRDYWISNNIDHFRSALSSFWSFIFHQ